jgi:predicted nucleic acid-binding protein
LRRVARPRVAPTDEASAEADAVLDRIAAGETAVAPDIFRLEIQNVLLSAERMGRIRADQVDEALERLRDLPIHIENSDDRFVSGSELALARSYDLTTYDAAYLTCADDSGLELVTADAPLDRAARDFGLTTTFVG